MRFKLLSALMVAAMLAACFSTEDSPNGNAKTTDKDSTKIVYVLDSVLLASKLDSLKKVNDSLRLAALKADSLKNNPHGIGGWDDFPNKYRPTLIELANKMQQLPMPLGTRYSAQPKDLPLSKAAAVQSCAGLYEIAGFHYNNNTLYGLDTISYYDNANQPHCDWQNPTTRETHARHMIDEASGDVWEKIDIKILDDNVLPNYLTHGTGRMLLNNGMKINIDSYDVDAMVIYGDSNVSVRSASLALSWQDGYSFKLDLAKPRPFKVVDLFPIWGANPSLGIILSGPILHPGATAGSVDTLGYADLYADHTVSIRDWTGALVKPTP